VLPATTWLVHFTPDADGIVRCGFRWGQPDMHGLGWTKFREGRHATPGWNFAVRADSDHDVQAVGLDCEENYGCTAVILQAPCVGAYHRMDDTLELIFWGPGAREVVPVWHVGPGAGGWTARDRLTGREVLRESEPAGLVERVIAAVESGTPAARASLLRPVGRCA
jgi:hypothetical protein